MSKSVVFRFSLLSFLFGVAAGSFFFSLSPTLPLLSVALGAGMLGVFPDRRGVVGFLIALVFAGGFFSAASQERVARTEHVTGEVRGVAEIVRKPDRKDFSTVAVVRLRSCETNFCPRERISAQFPLTKDISFGDTGAFSCTLSIPEPEWNMYYAKEGVAFLCRRAQWEKERDGSGFLAGLLSVAGRFEASVERFLPEPESALAEGLLLGGEGRLPAGVKDSFRAAGLSHIVAVSGYNISIIAAYFLLLGIVFLFDRRTAAVFALVGTILFVIVSGNPPSSIRAIGMASALMLSWWLGRRYASVWAILFAASAMLLWNPLFLRHDIGFLLSFLATFGIVTLSPVFGMIVGKLPFLARMFSEAFLLTVSAELFILPVVFANFETFSFAALPANTLLLPLVPIAMLLSFLVGVFGMLFPLLGTLLSFPAYAVLHAIIAGAEFSGSWQWARVEWSGFGWHEAFVWYSILIGTVFFLKRTVLFPRRASSRIV